MSGAAIDVARAAAQKLDMIDDRGELVPVDSLMAVDLLTELENATGLVFAPQLLRAEAFVSLASVARLVEAAMNACR